MILKITKIARMRPIPFIWGLCLVACSLHAAPQSASSWQIETPNLEGLRLKVTHMSSKPTSLWLAQKDEQGQILKTVSLGEPLEPGQKRSLVFNTNGFKNCQNCTFLLSANQKMGVSMESGQGKRAILKPLSQSEFSRDDRGVWFIEGGNLYDVSEMMGYAVAQDRLWQMELFRRTATGTLAEIFGSDFLSQDILARTFGYSDEELEGFFAGLDTDSKDMIQGYVDGVNRHIGEINADPPTMPFEFFALGFPAIQPWTRVQLMAWISILQRQFSLGNFGIEQVENAANLQILVATQGVVNGASKFLDTYPVNDPSAPTMIPPGENLAQTLEAPAERRKALLKSLGKITQGPDLREAATRLRNLFDTRRENLQKIGAYVKGGSYAWVVSGDHTESGNPILFSGVQTTFETPSTVVEGSVVSDAYTASGMTIPGVPVFIVARTPNHTWSMQIGHANMFDYYFESPENIFFHREETFHVAGGEPVSIPVLRSSRGPVVNPDPLLSWKYADWGREWNLGTGILGMIRSENMDTFGQALNHLSLTVHICYADRANNIAYWMTGADPVRPPGIYLLPQGALGAPLDYDASIRHPFPHARNPEQGYFAGWNTAASIDTTVNTGLGFGTFHRGIVVQDFFKQGGPYSFEDLRELGFDIANTHSFNSGGNPWAAVADIFTAAVEGDPTPERIAALEVLAQWHGHYPAGGPSSWIAGMDVADGWMLQDRWITRTLDKVFNDDLAPLNIPAVRRLNIFLREFRDDGLRNFYRAYFRNTAQIQAPNTAFDTICTALDEVLAELGPQPWGSDARRTINFNHVLLGPLFQLPFANRASYAQIVEMGPDGPVQIKSYFPLGATGLIRVGPEGQPQLDPLFFAMQDIYAVFQPRSFPLFPPK